MMNSSHPQGAAAFNQLYKECGDIYHGYARRFGLSEAALIILCAIYESPTPLTQRQLAAEWHYPPQTVNSILKRLETEGLLTLTAAPDNRRSKQVHFTEKGSAFAARVIAPLIAAEDRAFCALSPSEQQALLTLTRRYMDNLREEVD